jgi:hypothetical protein
MFFFAIAKLVIIHTKKDLPKYDLAIDHILGSRKNLWCHVANPKANSVQPKSKKLLANVPPPPPPPGNPIHARWNPGSSLSWPSVLALPLARALAVFALRIVESTAFAARRERIQYKSFVSEVSVRRLSFVDFLWYRVRSLNLFHYLSEFRRVLRLLLVCGQTPVCIAVSVFPVLCRNGGISPCCFLFSCSYYYCRCVRSRISWFHGLGGLRAFIADGERTWC